MIHKLCYHPRHQIHIQRRVRLLGLFLLRFQGHGETGLPCFIVVLSCPALRPIGYILRLPFLLVLLTQTRIGATKRRLAFAVP